MGNARWKRLLHSQAPYRWNVRHLNLGETLDVGCGLGRNLTHLDGHGVGVDTNPASVDVCRTKGLVAYTADEFFGSDLSTPGSFDSLLVAHVLEHMSAAEASSLINAYLPSVRLGGQVVVITPQERGFESDPTHVRFVDFSAAADLARSFGLTIVRQYSFPFPRHLGRYFVYNEFVTVARKR